MYEWYRGTLLNVHAVVTGKITPGPKILLVGQEKLALFNLSFRHTLLFILCG